MPPKGPVPVLPRGFGSPFINPFGKLPSPFPAVHPDAPRSKATEYDEIATGTVEGSVEDIKKATSLGKGFDWQGFIPYGAALLFIAFGFLMISRGK